MTVFANKTVRIVISDLEYRDRPCVLIFRRMSEGRYEYEIVPREHFSGPVSDAVGTLYRENAIG